jgi:hypothetical protein
VSEEISVTTFDDATAPEKTIADVGVPSEVSDDLSSLKRFLGKPRLMGTGMIETLPDNFDAPYDFYLFFNLFDILSKLYNYCGLRFTMCAKVTLNVTPYDSGQVALLYTPPYYRERVVSGPKLFATYSQIPNAEMNVSEITSVELRVPYFSPKRFLQTKNVLAPNYLGAFHVTSPLKNIFSSNSSQYKLYFWIEDVELLYPTNLFNVGKVREALKWRPQAPDKQTISNGTVVLSQNNYDSNYQVTAQAVPLCMNVINNDYSDQATTTFYDLIKIPCVVKNWKLDSPVNTHPVGFAAQYDCAKYQIAKAFFAFYSGSINYRLTMFKTKYHSGRMQVAFLPNFTATDMMPNTLDDFWNIIWDFRESSVLEFSVPYVNDNFLTSTREYQGVLVFKMLNELQAPDNVAQAPTIMLEAWAGDDLRLYAPYSEIRTQYQAVSIPPRSWEPQGPKSISDKPVVTPPNYINEGDCSLAELAAKYSPITLPVISPQTVNSNYLPVTVRAIQFDITTAAVSISPADALANIFQFYRADIVGKVPVDDISSFYYTRVDSLGSDFAVVPYISNLRYNEVGIPSHDPIELENGRLHNARFFYPWYPLRVVL